MCRSARPIGSLGLGSSSRSDVVPDREEERPPLLGRVGDGALEGARLGVQERGGSARGASGPGRRQSIRSIRARYSLRPTRRVAIEPRRRAGFDCQDSRTDGQPRRRAEELDRRAEPPTGRSATSAIASPRAECRAQLGRRAARSGSTFRPVSPRVRSKYACEIGIADVSIGAVMRRPSSLSPTAPGISIAPK